VDVRAASWSVCCTRLATTALPGGPGRPLEAAGGPSSSRAQPRAVTLIPRYFCPVHGTAGGALRDAISFIKREDVLGIGGVVAGTSRPALRLRRAVGRDLFRAITSWEANGRAGGEFALAGGRVLYTRNTESTTVGAAFGASTFCTDETPYS